MFSLRDGKKTLGPLIYFKFLLWKEFAKISRVPLKLDISCEDITDLSNCTFVNTCNTVLAGKKKDCSHIRSSNIIYFWVLSDLLAAECDFLQRVKQERGRKDSDSISSFYLLH